MYHIKSYYIILYHYLNSRAMLLWLSPGWYETCFSEVQVTWYTGALTFSKTKMSKGIPGKNAQKNVQPRKNPYNTRIPRES